MNSVDGRAATEGYSPQDTDKLFVVDCLLPGQVRKLGSQMTYLTARRAIKTTAGECETRGGEYVAYDRANFASALKIWLPLAKQGDVEAQIHVGEVYEKGMGTQSDPKLAAEWYKKAADTGNSKAQISLGYLYEKGLGVPKDVNKAMGLYRQASGLGTTDLPFETAAQEPAASAPAVAAAPANNPELENLRQEASRNKEEANQLRQQLAQSKQQAVATSSNDQELEALRQESSRNKNEAMRLRQQLSDTQQQLSAQQNHLQSLRTKLEQKKQLLEQERNKASKNEALVSSLKSEMQASQSELDKQSSKVSSLESNLKTQERSVAKQTAQASAPQSSAAPQASSGNSSSLQAARDELQKNQALLKEKEAAYLEISNGIKRDLANSSSTTDASSAHAQLDQAQLRTNLDEQKKALKAQGQEIAALKSQVAEQQETVAKLEQSGEIQTASIDAQSANIEIIDPPMVLTRGIPSLQLTSNDKSKDITGKVQAAAGLKSLLVNDKPETVGGDGVFHFNVPIEGQTTTVKIVATDKQDKQTSMNLNILAQEAGGQAAAADAGASAKSVGSGKNYNINFGRFYALVIGNNNYSQMPTLKTAVNDAQSIAGILSSQYGFKTTVLTNANRHQIMTALNNIRNQLKENDNLLVYYAGHGELDKTTKEAYWLPTDAELNNNANWISTEAITQYLSIIEAKHILVVADSCYSGAMTGNSVVRLPEDMPEAKREKWLKFMSTRKARTVLTSGGVQPVLDQGSDQHSIFASALINSLKKNAGLIEDYDVFRVVSQDVKASASRVGFAQSPQYGPLQHAGHEGSPFFFVPES